MKTSTICTIISGVATIGGAIAGVIGSVAKKKEEEPMKIAREDASIKKYVYEYFDKKALESGEV